MDIYSTQKRSAIMSAIKNKGSKIENIVKNLLKQRRVQYRSHVRSLPGNPDFFITKYGAAIFVDSCFWHGCRYHCTLPKSNKNFWKCKILRNKERDRKINKEYKNSGWKIIRIWEHSLAAETGLNKLNAFLGDIKNEVNI